MNFDIKQHTIFRTLTGSRVYGTYTEASDYDYRGVAIPPQLFYLGYNSAFSQFSPSEGDEVIYGFNKFLKLAADNNPNVIELLYVPKKYWTTTSAAWETLVEAKELFLSKKCYHTFRGYAHSQLKRLRSHRGWLMKGDLKKPRREDYGLIEEQRIPTEVRNAAKALIERRLDKWLLEEELSTIDKPTAMALRNNLWDFLERMLSLSKMEIEGHAWTAAAKTLGYETNFMELLQKEKQYYRDAQEYKSWMKWKTERNPKRRELEIKVGYDAKHAMHLVRLLKMCREILVEHTIHVERPDVDLLRAVKDGKWSYEQLDEWAMQQHEELAVAHDQSDLRHSPNRKKIEDVGITIVTDFWDALRSE